MNQSRAPLWLGPDLAQRTTFFRLEATARRGAAEIETGNVADPVGGCRLYLSPKRFFHVDVRVSGAPTILWISLRPSNSAPPATSLIHGTGLVAVCWTEQLPTALQLPGEGHESA